MEKRQIFLGGGVGDIFALEATMTDEYRKSIVRIYWATRSRPHMVPLFAKLPSFPNLIDHVSLGDFIEEGFVFKDVEGAYEASLCRHLLVGPVEDWSIYKRFNPAQPFNYSSFVRYKLANISKFNLPNDYVFVCPYSTMTSKSAQLWRRFFDRDWEWLIDHLHKTKTFGVVVNIGDDLVPESEWLINLSNKTKLAEAIEIGKMASGYIGIGSAFSVLAAQTLPASRIMISGVEKQLWAYRHVYYAPKTDFSFLVPFLGATKQEIEEWSGKYSEEIKETREWIIENNKSKNLKGWTETNCGLKS